LTDDVIIVAASIFALGSTVIISTAVDSGLGKKKCLLNEGDLEQIQLKLFVTTILFVLTTSLAKSSVLLFLYHLADNTFRRASVLAIGVLVLVWTIAVLAGTIFQCELPTPWMVWTGRCIPLVNPNVVLQL
jgi:membrane-anchored glycerophosphoryl diester phosphodiesterase (GDPDase)